MVDGGNEEGADELPGHVLGEGDAAETGPAMEAGAVRRVRVGSNGDERCAADGEQVEGVDDVTTGEGRELPGV